MNVDKGLVAGAVLIDLAKVFDTVDHDILICKLKHYGVCDESIPWFENIFSGRKQFVCIDSLKSLTLLLECRIDAFSDPCCSLPIVMTYHVD